MRPIDNPNHRHASMASHTTEDSLPEWHLLHWAVGLSTSEVHHSSLTVPIMRHGSLQYMIGCLQKDSLVVPKAEAKPGRGALLFWA